MATLYSYALPDIATTSGTLSVTLYSEYSGLTVPSGQTISNIGPRDEAVDFEPGVQQAATLIIDIVDDTTTYTEGFWYKVLGGTTLLKFVLDENGTNRYFFFGGADTVETEWTEFYVGASSYKRTAQVMLVSLEQKLFSGYTYDALMTEAMLHKVLNTPDTWETSSPYSMIRIKNLFSCMLKVSGLNATYDADDTSVIYDTSNPDFLYTYTGAASPYGFRDVWVMLEKIQDPGNPAAGGTTVYDDSVITTAFVDLKKFISCIVNSFSLVIQGDYDVDSERFKIRLSQRGRAHPDSENIVEPKFEESTIRISTDLRTTGVSASNVLNSAEIGWIADNTATVTDIDVPDYIDDIQTAKATLWKVVTDKTPPLDYTVSSLFMLFYVSGVLDDGTEDPTLAANDFVDEVRYWNYHTDAYVTLNTGSESLEKAVAGYLYYRFYDDRRVITRRYDGISLDDGSGSSLANTRALMRISINDGVSARAYFANSVRVLIAENATIVEWIEE